MPLPSNHEEAKASSRHFIFCVDSRARARGPIVIRPSGARDVFVPIHTPRRTAAPSDESSSARTRARRVCTIGSYGVLRVYEHAWPRWESDTHGMTRADSRVYYRIFSRKTQPGPRGLHVGGHLHYLFPFVLLSRRVWFLQYGSWSPSPWPAVSLDTKRMMHRPN